MLNDTDKPDRPIRKRRRKSKKRSEESLRLATIIKRENISEINANGFLASSDLKPTDRMTISSFKKQYRSWRNQPVGGSNR